MPPGRDSVYPLVTVERFSLKIVARVCIRGRQEEITGSYVAAQHAGRSIVALEGIAGELDVARMRDTERERGGSSRCERVV